MLLVQRVKCVCGVRCGRVVVWVRRNDWGSCCEDAAADAGAATVPDGAQGCGAAGGGASSVIAADGVVLAPVPLRPELTAAAHAQHEASARPRAAIIESTKKRGSVWSRSMADG